MGFQGNINEALDLICLSLKNLNFEWQAPKRKDCRLKCRISIENELMVNDEKTINDFLSRKFLRFDIRIFKEPNKFEGKSRGAIPTKIEDDTKPKGEINKFATNYMIDV